MGHAFANEMKSVRSPDGIDCGFGSMVGVTGSVSDMAVMEPIRSVGYQRKVFHICVKFMRKRLRFDRFWFFVYFWGRKSCGTRNLVGQEILWD